MKVLKTKIEGVYIIDPEPRVDERGHFLRVFAREVLKESGIDFNIVHINRSLSKSQGTIRGLHYQKTPFGEDKIVQCLSGSIFDVAVDLRKSSPTYGNWVGEVLDEKNQKMLLIPKGFAHGFQTLTKGCVVEYFVTQYYKPDKESGARWDDSAFNIKWPLKKPYLSEKDSAWPDFKL